MIITYIKVNTILYPAEIIGMINDYQWDNRESKTIILNMTYSEVIKLLPDNTSWSIVQKDDEKQIGEYDNSEFCLSGPITDYRDGRVSIKMGKTTDLEDAYAMMIGG